MSDLELVKRRERLLGDSLDVDGFVGESPFWGRFWEEPRLGSSERRLIESARIKVQAVLSRYEKRADGYSLIHADLHPGNILFDGSRLHLIDFDDAGFGWHIYDLAVALFYYQSRRDFDSILKALVFGSSSARLRLSARPNCTTAGPRGTGRQAAKV